MLNKLRPLKHYPKSTEDLIRGLVEHGCSDLRSLINPTTISEFPCAGGGFCDVHRGALYDGTKVAIKCLRLYEPESAVENGTLRLALNKVGFVEGWLIVEKLIPWSWPEKQAAREIYYWVQLKHRNVLPLMGLTVFRERISMVSEWMENGDLRSYIERNPGINLIKLCIDICEGLFYLHENEMAHGDMKSANIVVSPDGTAMITDFGNIKSLSKNPTLKYTCGSKRGLSYRWGSPELLRADTSAPQMSKEADVWAFGMTILEMLTGQAPYCDLTEVQVIGMIAYENKTPPRPDLVCDELWSILNICWTWDPDRRPGIMIINDRLRELIHNHHDSQPMEPQQAPAFGKGIPDHVNHTLDPKWERYLLGDTSMYFENVSLYLGRCHYFIVPADRRHDFLEDAIFALSPSRGTISRVDEDLTHQHHLIILDYSLDPVVQFKIGPLTYQWNPQSETLAFEFPNENSSTLRPVPQLRSVELYDDPKDAKSWVKRSKGRSRFCKTIPGKRTTLNIFFWVVIAIGACCIMVYIYGKAGVV